MPMRELTTIQEFGDLTEAPMTQQRYILPGGCKEKVPPSAEAKTPTKKCASLPRKSGVNLWKAIYVSLYQI